MDNQYENDFYGFEPQKPLTEKDSATAPAGGAEAFDFEPQKPLMQPQPPQEEQGFNPIQHTAVYADNRFVGNAAPQQQAPPAQDYYAQPQPYYQPARQYPPVQPSAPQPEAQPKKSKTNIALVTVIIVLGALLATSLFGIVGYSVYNSSQNPSKTGTDSLESEIDRIEREFGERDNGDNGDNGGGFFRSTPAETPTNPTHDESDFSDQANKNYGGLVLNDKPADAKTNAAYSAEYAFESASDSVVSVLCFADKPTDDNTSVSSQGSGIVISDDGFIVTNAHVVGNSKTAYAIKVITSDDKEYTAGVVGFDSRTDIAVLKLKDAKGLKPATFGNSDKIQLGEDLIIIGNPGGIEYKNSMSKGIVSAINRSASSKSIVKYIQTDAAINPGNSGGPAVNIYGQVVGVASAKIVDEKYEGMGFCIPSAQTKVIVDTLIKNGYVDGRVKIGISGQAITAEEAQYGNLPLGIKVASIAEGGPCDNTDLRKDDIITMFDGKTITSFSDIYQALEEHRDGDRVKLKFYRQTDGEQHEIEITLQADK